MAALMRIVIGCAVAAAAAGTAIAAPAARAARPPAAPATAQARYRAAQKLASSGNNKQALAEITEALAMTPQDKPLLRLKASVLFDLRDIEGAIAAYQAFLDAGATGADRREVEQIIIVNLRAAPTVDITLASGSGEIYLDSKLSGVFCTATPSCSRKIMPGAHRLIVERPGFQPINQRIVIQSGTPLALPITLVEEPSLLTVRVDKPGAQITVDDAAYTEPVKVAGGSHRVVVALAGHVEAHLDAAAHEGKPVAVDVALVPLVPLHVEPAGADLVLDGKPVTAAHGNLAVPAGAHQLTVRAPNYVERSEAIPADLPADYKLDIQLVAMPLPDLRPPPSTFTTRRKIALAAGGVAVISGVVGVVLGRQANQADDDAFALCPSPTTPCANAAKADELNSHGQSRATQANVAFGMAGASAVAAAVLWLAGAPESRSRVAVTPRISSTPGVDVSVRF